MAKRYLEQFERVKRWYALITEIDSGRPHTLPSEHYLDFFRAFFMECHHLKDWIIKSGTATNQDVEKYINKNTCLVVCADICNANKHLENGNRSKLDPKQGNKRIGVTLGDGIPHTTLKYDVVYSDNRRQDAFELATECVEAWERFLTAISP